MTRPDPPPPSGISFGAFYADITDPTATRASGTVWESTSSRGQLLDSVRLNITDMDRRGDEIAGRIAWLFTLLTSVLVLLMILMSDL